MATWGYHRLTSIERSWNSHRLNCDIHTNAIGQFKDTLDSIFGLDVDHVGGTKTLPAGFIVRTTAPSKGARRSGLSGYCLKGMD